MPLPTLSDVHVDSALSHVSVAYIQSQTQFVATQAFPIISVQHRSDQYPLWDRGDTLRDELTYRAPATENQTIGNRISWHDYACKVRGGKMAIPDQTRNNQDSSVTLEMAVTRIATQKALISTERVWADKFFKASAGWSEPSSAVTKWDTSGGDPIGDIETGINAIAQYGFMPNTLVLGYRAYKTLKHHADIVDRYKHTTSQSITPNMIARIFDLNRIIVASAAYNSADELQTESTNFILSDGALLLHTPSSPGLLTPAAGYTWAWTSYLNSGMEATVSRYREPKLRADFIEVETAFDMTAVDWKLGYYINDVAS